jgi:hypothetical protein
MAKASAALLLTSRRRNSAGDTKGIYKELATQRAMSSVAETAKVVFGELYPELLQAAMKARLEHAPRGQARTASKYKRKLAKRAALLGMLESLEHEAILRGASNGYGFTSGSTSNLSASSWRALLQVETAGASDAWMGLVQRLANAVTIKLKSASEAEKAFANSSSLLESTPVSLRDAITQHPGLLARAAELERATSFVVLPRPPGGKSFIHRPRGSDLSGYVLDAETRRQVAAVVQAAGARIVHEGRFAMTVECNARLASQILGVALRLELETDENDSVENTPRSPQLLHVQPVGGKAGWTLDAVVDHVEFLPPPLPAIASATPPQFNPPHLSHDQVRHVLGADAACAPWTGGDEDALENAVKVAVLDTGCDATHPIFKTVKGTISFVSTHAGPKPQDDQDGHGTAMAWSVLTTAPNSHVLAIQHGGQPDQAIDKALDAGAQVLCCAWKIKYPLPYLEGLIEAAIDDGAIVLFAGGNGQQAWPGDMPSVISVGGAYPDPSTFDTRPSTYTSWYESQRYPGRVVPDVCGISGDRPRGVFLPLPVPAMSVRDRRSGTTPYPNGDNISPVDGWIYASGSSAAVAQVSGVAALLVQKARSLGTSIKQTDVKNLLKNGSTTLNFPNNSLFQGSTSGANVPKHPGTVNAAASLALV